MTKLTCIKPRLAETKSKKTAALLMPPVIKRLSGNSLYAVMKQLDAKGPRICAECDDSGSTSVGDELDHIIPLHLGGGNEITNLQWLCKEHHAIKSKKETKGRGV